ncbi:MAG: trimethylamine methyltransferase family protein [Anaerolineae bacterium]
MNSGQADSRFALLHEATLKLLGQTGVRLESVLARDLLAGAGARVEAVGQRVYLRQEQVEWALASAPKLYHVYGRRTEELLCIGGDNVYVLAGGGSVRVLSLDWRSE